MSAVPSLDPDELNRLIEGVLDTFDFTRPGEGGETVGKDLAVRVGHRIQVRSLAGKDPEGEDWRPNEDRYAKYKRERYDVHLPGELGGQMLSMLSLVGKPDIGPDTVEMTYGWNQPPQKTDSRSGVPLKPHELKATDRQKASWFEDGGREFYALNDEDCDALTELAADALGRHLDGYGLG